MNAQNVFDAAQLVAAAGVTCAICVQLVVAFVGIDTARLKVGTAFAASLVLTLAYAVSSGLLVPADIFGLLVATITVTATGAGFQHSLTSVVAPPKAGPGA